jgi:hypothetical protein
LPERSADFGPKTARVYCAGVKLIEQVYEVFFPCDACNHPGEGSGQTPNWFYYWLQTVTPLRDPPPRVIFFPSEFSFYELGTDRIHLGADIPTNRFPVYCATPQLVGIERFGWAYVHEAWHHKSWREWWGLATVDEWWASYAGKDGPDGDKDSDVIPNRIEWASGRYDWTNKYTLYEGKDPQWAGADDWEDMTCRTNWHAKGDRSKDWADPGMNHGEVGNHED